MAVGILGMFGLGLWMVDLTYYDPWYRRAPDIHKGTGVLLFLLLLFRLFWKQVNPRPVPEPTLSTLQQRASAGVQALLYMLLVALMASGYMISTADGRPIDVFRLFHVPATLTGLPNQADIAGDIHFVLAVATVSLASFHAAAALKHHFVDRDRTLRRMLGCSNSPAGTTTKRIHP
jgi:cytochrome b561